MTFRHRPSSGNTLHYLTIDGTGPIDSLAFGNLLSYLFPSWKNLCEGLPLNVIPGTNGMGLLQPGKPLLMRTAATMSKTGQSFRDICVMPQGRLPSVNQNPTLSEKQIVEGNLFTHDLILRPGANATGLTTKGADRVADLLFLSGHGYQSGEMKGDSPIDERYFSLGRAGGEGQAFVGPKWIFLSNCNTLHEGLNPQWLTLFGEGSSLRGVVGFRDLFPDAEGSVVIYKSFLMKLARGETIRDAWRKTIEAQAGTDIQHEWTVLCRDDAHTDTLQAWEKGKLTPLGKGAVFRYDADTPAGKVVEPDPDRIDLAWLKPGRVTVADKHLPQHQLRVGDEVTVVLHAPQDQRFVPDFTIQVIPIFIRMDYPQVVDVDGMFDLIGAQFIAPTGITTARLNTLPRRPPFKFAANAAKFAQANNAWVIKPDRNSDRIKFTLRCKSLSDFKAKGEPLGLTVRVLIGSTFMQGGTNMGGSIDVMP